MLEQHTELDWLFWIDSDALFMNMDIKLHQLLVGVSDTDVIVIAPDAEGLNAGTFFVPSSQPGREFCEELLQQRSKYHYEQGALSALYNKAVRESGQECAIYQKDNYNHPSGIKACLDKKAPGFRILRLCAMGSWGGLEWKPGHGFYFDDVYMNGYSLPWRKESKAWSDEEGC